MSAMQSADYDPITGESFETSDVEPFSYALARHGITLRRGETNTLQINVGLLCNQICRHCHLRAGPNRKEIMDLQTMKQVSAFAARSNFRVIDITGGAPEMNPNLEYLIETLAPSVSRFMLRSNLTLLNDDKHADLINLCVKHQVVIVASLPSINMAQTESQRGIGVWDKSIMALRKLNESGYGYDGSSLELNLVSNPTGAFLPPLQSQAEKKFKKDLKHKWGIVFNNLYAFANVPLGRFREWLIETDNLEKYMARLTASFNPGIIDGLMCRTLMSVSWDGYLFDCDFNLSKNIYLNGSKKHVSQMEGLPEPGMAIMTGDHCYACTAGAGFS
jgi:radical SAM/Cys-rich protein